MAAKYTVEKGESPKDVARKFTGDPQRDIDMMPLNPNLRTVTGHMGRPKFDSFDWHDGLTVNIPNNWMRKRDLSPSPYFNWRGPNGMPMASFLSGPKPRKLYDPTKRALSPFYQRRVMSGYLGADDQDVFKKEEQEEGNVAPGCNYAPKGTGAVKPYMFAVPEGETLISITQKWLGKDDVYGRGLYTWSELAAVNRTRVDDNCWVKASAGGLIQVPADWPAIPSNWADRRRNPDGTPYTDAEPDAPEPPGGSGGIDRVSTVEGEDSGLVWFVLAAAAAVGGGILLYNSKKKKR